MVCWLMADTLHVRVVVPLALPTVAVIAQALINPFAIENRHRVRRHSLGRCRSGAVSGASAVGESGVLQRRVPSTVVSGLRAIPPGRTRTASHRVGE